MVALIFSEEPKGLGSSAAVIMQDYEIPDLQKSRLENRDSRPPSRMIAYIAADEAGESLVDLLRLYVCTRLPDYMVPSSIMTARGTASRAREARPRSRTGSGQASVRPRRRHERRLRLRLLVRLPVQHGLEQPVEMTGRSLLKIG